MNNVHGDNYCPRLFLFANQNGIDDDKYAFIVQNKNQT